jgi:hypothetical protein
MRPFQPSRLTTGQMGIQSTDAHAMASLQQYRLQRPSSAKYVVVCPLLFVFILAHILLSSSTYSFFCGDRNQDEGSPTNRKRDETTTILMANVWELVIPLVASACKPAQCTGACSPTLAHTFPRLYTVCAYTCAHRWLMIKRAAEQALLDGEHGRCIARRPHTARILGSVRALDPDFQR